MDFPAITGSPLWRNRGEARCPSITSLSLFLTTPHRAIAKLPELLGGGEASASVGALHPPRPLAVW